jgi:hypothetical protein
MKVWIVSKLFVNKSSVWVHGLTEEHRNVRILRPNGSYPSTNTKFEVGQIWDLTFQKSFNIVPPHTEDILVTNWKFIGQQKNMLEFLQPRVKIWEGTIYKLFDGCIDYVMGDGKIYISAKRGIPDMSMGYWLPDRPLLKWHNPLLFTPHGDEGYPCYRYHLSEEFLIGYTGFSYTSFAKLAFSISGLIHVSLGKWWVPKNELAPAASSRVDKRCYLQISDWYQ